MASWGYLLLLCLYIKFLMVCSYVPNPVLVIIDVQPKELGIPTKAYYDVEEVKEVMGLHVLSWLLSLIKNVEERSCLFLHSRQAIPYSLPCS